MVSFGGPEFISPRDLATAVRDESVTGQQYLASVSMIVREVRFETYLKSIKRSGWPRSRVLRFLLELLTRMRPEPINPRSRGPEEKI